MKPNPTHIVRLTALTAALAAATTVSAQTGLLSSQGVIVAYSGDTIPDTAGAPISGLTFTNSGLNTNCAVDASGNVLFLGQFTQVVPGDSSNDRALFYGSNRANLKMVIRGADQAPGMAAGILLRNATTTSALGTTYRLTPNGSTYWGSGLYDGGILITGGANSEANFGGLPTSLGLLVQKRDQAPGCPAGCQFNQAIGSPNLILSGMNDSGRIYFASALTGTGVSTTAGSNNQMAIFTGMPGALELIARRNDPVNGIPGAVAVDTSSALTTVMQMNASGNVLYDVLLSTTQGTPPATLANNWALMQFTPGATPGTGTSAVIVREGDGAPGTFPVATFNSVIAGDVWNPLLAPNCWTRSNKVIFTAELRGGDVTTLPNGIVNDRAIYMGGVGSLTMVVRKGDAAAGTDAFFAAANSSTNPFDVDSVMMNDSGRVVFNGMLQGGTSTTANDTGLWTGVPGGLQLIAREGSIEPITGGTIAPFNNITSTSGLHFNDSGRVLYKMTLTGGTNAGPGLWLYDPYANTNTPVFLPGNQVEVSPGVFKAFSASGTPFGELTNNNSDGASLMFMHNGKIGLKVTFSDNTTAIMTLSLPLDTPSTPFCLGDGTGAACPCGNTGATGHGCASSAFATGAILTSSGNAGASAGTDTLVLTATGIPGPGLFFQASGLAPTPFNFGDGHLCAAVSIIRMGVVFSSGGVASYPGGTTPNPIHIAGLTSNGDVRHYQCWYRSVPSLCTAIDNYNTTQGLTLTWGL